MTSLKDAKDHPSVVQMEAPSTYRQGSVSQRRESNVSAKVRAGRASFTRQVILRYTAVALLHFANVLLRSCDTHRTHDGDVSPGQERKDMAETLRRLEQIFTITPQRMRKIVDGFQDVLENGLEKPDQMVVRLGSYRS